MHGYRSGRGGGIGIIAMQVPARADESITSGQSDENSDSRFCR